MFGTGWAVTISRDSISPFCFLGTISILFEEEEEEEEEDVEVEDWLEGSVGIKRFWRFFGFQ